MSLHRQEEDTYTTDHPAARPHDVEQPDEADHQGRLDEKAEVVQQSHDAMKRRLLKTPVKR